MPKQIRTKWHDFLDCYRKGQIQLNIGGGKFRSPSRFKNWNQSPLDTVLAEITLHPEVVQHFVFEDDARPFIVSKQAIDTIEVLKRFNKYRLPAPICLAEFQTTDRFMRAFVLCYENDYVSKHRPLQPARSQYPFSVVCFGLLDIAAAYEKSSLKEKLADDGTPMRPIYDQCAVIYPVRAHMENVPGTYEFDDALDRFGNADEITYEKREIGGVTYSMEPVPWIDMSRAEYEREEVNINHVHGTFVSIGGYAIRALTVMLNTKGIGRERIADADICKLNKRRNAKRIPTIPAHVYIHIASYTNRKGAQVLVGDRGKTGRKQRFHMRSAHVKQQPYGPGKSLRKEIMVDSYLVNEDEGGDLYNPVRVVTA